MAHTMAFALRFLGVILACSALQANAYRKTITDLGKVGNDAQVEEASQNTSTQVEEESQNTQLDPLPPAFLGGSHKTQAPIVKGFYDAQNAIGEREGLPVSSVVVGAKEKGGDCQKLIFLSDLEGNNDAWTEVVKNSGAFEQISMIGRLASGSTDVIGYGRVNLKNEYCLVYGGDTLDSGAHKIPDSSNKPIDITRNLVELYEANPGRVVLCLGNRDLNKLRLKTELEPTSDHAKFWTYWTAANARPTADKDGNILVQPWENVGKVTALLPHKWAEIGTRLDNIMSASMGASISGYQTNLKFMKKSKSLPDKTTTAEYLRDILLSPTKEGNVFYRYLQYGVLLGAAKIGDEFALFSHTGIHPLMFGGAGIETPGATAIFSRTKRGCLMVPTAAGLGVTAAEIVSWPKKGGLQLDVQVRERTAIERDIYAHPMPSDRTKGTGCGKDLIMWAKDYASWKTADFTAWSQSAPGGWDSATRPGLQLMDAGVANLAGIYRNAGFTEGGPCTAWEYGVQTAFDAAETESLAFYQPGLETYNRWGTPTQFGNQLKTDYKVKYLYNGHFTEPLNAVPSQYKMGGVVVHNHDLTKATGTGGIPTPAWASYSDVHVNAGRGFESDTYRMAGGAFTKVSSPEISDVGKSFAVTDALGLKKLCQAGEQGFSYAPWDPSEDSDHPVWYAWIQDIVATKTNYKVTFKLLNSWNRFSFVFGNDAKYCFAELPATQTMVDGKAFLSLTLPPGVLAQKA